MKRKRDVEIQTASRKKTTEVKIGLDSKTKVLNVLYDCLGDLRLIEQLVDKLPVCQERMYTHDYVNDQISFIQTSINEVHLPTHKITKNQVNLFASLKSEYSSKLDALQAQVKSLRTVKANQQEMQTQFFDLLYRCRDKMESLRLLSMSKSDNDKLDQIEMEFDGLQSQIQHAFSVDNHSIDFDSLANDIRYLENLNIKLKNISTYILLEPMEEDDSITQTTETGKHKSVENMLTRRQINKGRKPIDNHEEDVSESPTLVIGEDGRLPSLNKKFKF